MQPAGWRAGLVIAVAVLAGGALACLTSLAIVWLGGDAAVRIALAVIAFGVVGAVVAVLTKRSLPLIAGATSFALASPLVLTLFWTMFQVRTILA